MGLVKTLLKMFSCKSKCSFNNQEYDFNFGELKLKDFELKNKDMVRIGSILNKRNRKPLIRNYTTSSI